MPARPKFNGRERYLTTNSTSNAFALTAGNKSSIYLADNYGFYTLGESRGVRISFFGTTTADTTFDCKVWCANTIPGSDPLSPNPGPTDVDLVLYGTASLTLGTGTGAGTSTIVTSSEKYCDTCTWTIGSYGTAMETAYGLGASGAYSPADNTIAYLLIPNPGANGLVLEFDRTGAVSCNAVIERATG